MRITSLTIKNYKAFQNITINNIPKFCVFVGANRTGKSTLFDVFGFLRDSLKNNIPQSLQRRGGFKEVITRGHEEEKIYIKKETCLDIYGSKDFLEVLIQNESRL